MTAETINQIIGINESYQLPDRMMEILLSEEKEKVMDEFMNAGEKLDHDWFTEYFEEEHSNKSKFSQDFTPHSVGRIVAEIAGQAEMIADICAGTGGLTIELWNKNKNAYYHCEEISERALPLLIFNMAIRNMNGEIYHCDTLKLDIMTVYELRKGKKYSEIKYGHPKKLKGEFDTIISNPPYSMPWNGDSDERFKKYGIPPKSKGDYAFIEHGLWLMKKGGTATFILPHGVLFRSGREGEIRKNIVKDNIWKLIIGLPEKLFLNTQIPVCIIQLKESSKEIQIINADQEFEKQGKINAMTDEMQDKIIRIVKERIQVEGLSEIVTMQAIEDNGYNLNIPRYVRKVIQEEIIDIAKVIKDICSIEKEIKEAEEKLIEDFENFIYQNKEEGEKVKNAVKEWKEMTCD